jgi:hypothetical protein
MDATKSKALNSTLRLVFSLAQGILLVFSTIFIYMMFGELNQPSTWFLLLLLTAVSYGVSVFLNMIIQYLACSKINAVQLMSASGIPAGVTAAVIVALALFPIFVTPVVGVLPEALSPLYKKAIGQGFYMFWAGLYGQLLASGFVQVCT